MDKDLEQMRWKVLSSEYINNEPWLVTRRDVCELPNGNIMQAYYVYEFPTWVSAFALTKNNEVVLVKQYRHALGAISIETPGGVVDKGEKLTDAIKREVLEETGYVFETTEYLGKVSPNPATNNNLMYMYLLTGGEKVAEQNLDHTEDLQVLLLTIDEVKQLLRENKIIQALHTTCMFYALNKLGEMQY